MLREQLPLGVADAVAVFITGPLLENPRRVGSPLKGHLTGRYKAVVRRDWRVIYSIDDDAGVVTVQDVDHRAHIYGH